MPPTARPTRSRSTAGVLSERVWPIPEYRESQRALSSRPLFLGHDGHRRAGTAWSASRRALGPAGLSASRARAHELVELLASQLRPTAVGVGDPQPELHLHRAAVTVRDLLDVLARHSHRSGALPVLGRARPRPGRRRSASQRRPSSSAPPPRLGPPAVRRRARPGARAARPTAPATRCADAAAPATAPRSARGSSSPAADHRAAPGCLGSRRSGAASPAATPAVSCQAHRDWMRTLACVDCGQVPKEESTYEYELGGQWTLRPGGRCWTAIRNTRSDWNGRPKSS